MTDNDRITDPAAIRAWFEQDWAEQYQPAPGYLDPVRAVEAEKRADVAEARLELAEARVDQLTNQLNLANDTLRRRGLAVNATGATNDELRATIARVQKLADVFDGIADNYEAGSLKYPTNSVTARSVAARLRATLVEPRES